MIVVNTETIPGYTITMVKGMVQGNTVRAKHAGRDIAAGFKNLVGGELKGYTELLTDSRREALERMLAQAKRIGDASGRIVIVYGEESALFDADSAEYVRECGGGHIPMIGIPNARHHLMLDQPIAFVSVLKTLLAV